MRIDRLIRHLSAAVLIALPAGAQAGLMPDSILVPITPSQLVITGTAGSVKPTTLFVPTVLLHLSVEGSMKAATTGTRTTSAVSATYAVVGLGRELVAEVAQVAQAELGARLRRAGHAVVTYDSVGAQPTLARLGRLAADTSVGAPAIRQRSPRATYAIIAPSDTQLLATADSAGRAILAAVARELGATVVVPELWYQAPQLERDISLVHGGVRTGMTVVAGMDLIRATLTFVAPSGATGSIALRRPLAGISDHVGELTHVDSTVTALGGGMTAAIALGRGDMIGVIRVGRARNRTSEDDYELTIAPGAYSRALLVGAVSFFRAAVAVTARE